MKRWFLFAIYTKILISDTKSIAKLTKIVVLAFSSVSESLALFYEDFGVNIKNVDDVDAMIRSSVKCFIASIF
jgi:hypothetical protein